MNEISETRGALKADPFEHHLWTEMTEHPVQPAHTPRGAEVSRSPPRMTIEKWGFCRSASVSYFAASLSALFTMPQYSWCIPKCRSKIGKTFFQSPGFVPAVTEVTVRKCQIVEGPGLHRHCPGCSTSSRPQSDSPRNVFLVSRVCSRRSLLWSLNSPQAAPKLVNVTAT